MATSRPPTIKSAIRERLLPVSAAFMFVLANAAYSQVATAQTGSGKVQIWGEYYGSFIGHTTYATMTNPSNPPGDPVGGPVGAKNDAQTVFIESGPSRYYQSNDGAIHPYGTSTDVNGNLGQFVWTSVNLANGGQYKYFVDNVTNNQGWNWASNYCNAYNCYQMQAINAGTITLTTLASGGEGIDSNAHFGTINDRYNTETGTDDVETPYCYVFPISTVSGDNPSSCYDAGYSYGATSWDVSY